MGVTIMPNDVVAQSGQTCVRFAGFTVFKNRDYGIYYNNEPSLELSNNIFSDNVASMFPMVVKPNPLSHECSDKFVSLTNSIFIGKSSGYDCTGETPASGTYINLSGHCRGPTGPSGESMGVMFPQFTGGINNAPEKPCGNIMAYNTICGKMTMQSKCFNTLFNDLIRNKYERLNKVSHFFLSFIYMYYVGIKRYMYMYLTYLYFNAFV